MPEPDGGSSVRRRPGRWLAVLLLCGVAAALLALRTGRIEWPDRYNPWSPLAIADTPNLLTRFKLMRLGTDDALCRQVLEQAAMRYQPLPDRVTGEGCGFHNAVRISATSVQVGSAFSLSCRAAVSLAMWEHHVLQPAALAHFGKPVRRIEHFGSYACRDVKGGGGGRRSRHATADALDVAGFVLEDGRRIRVVSDWSSAAPAQAPASAFLHEVHGGACRFFSAVLGPDYNAAHRDHLHLDRGSFGICR